MYLYLGQHTVLRKQDVIGVFDMDNCTSSRISRDFLSRAEKEGRLVDVSGALPKSFALCAPKHRSIGKGKSGKKAGKVYLSQLAPSTLLRRWDSGTADL